tara:strand:- start:261 stop:1460 length:1200 start_codon:yes stop_codon:yes gene_type:complete
MQIYLITFFILSILSIFEFFSKNKNSSIINIFILAILVWLIFIAGFRGAVFGDYCTYWNFFQVIPSLGDYIYRLVEIPDDISTEWLYNILFPMFTKVFSDSHVLYFTFVSAVALSINIFMLKKMSPLIFLSLLIYFSHVFLYKELQQIRSGLSSSLILLSIYFLSQRRISSYTGTYIFSTLIHTTAFVTIFGVISRFIFSFFKQKKTVMVFVLVFVIFLALIEIPLSILFFLETNITFPWKYYVYKDTIDGAGSTNFYSIGIFSNLTTVKYIFFSLISIMYFDELNKKNKYFKYAFFFYYTGTLWIIFFNGFAIIATRLASMLTVPEIILLPMLIILFKQKGLAFIFLVLFSFMQLILNTLYLSNVPEYDFIWNNVDLCQETFDHKMRDHEYIQLESDF